MIDGMVGVRASEVLSTMQHILSLRHSCLLAKHAIALGTVIIRHLSVGSFVGAQDTSPSLFLPRDPDASVAVRYRG